MQLSWNNYFLTITSIQDISEVTVYEIYLYFYIDNIYIIYNF